MNAMQNFHRTKACIYAVAKMLHVTWKVIKLNIYTEKVHHGYTQNTTAPYHSKYVHSKNQLNIIHCYFHIHWYISINCCVAITIMCEKKQRTQYFYALYYTY